MRRLESRQERQKLVKSPPPLKDALTFLAETIVHIAADRGGMFPERSGSDPGRIEESGLFCDPQLHSLTQKALNCLKY